jgi:adenine/guanine phosphoribosyltransferase-like PRPP-binding protein
MEHQPSYSCCYYLEDFIDPRKAKYIINECVAELRKLQRTSVLEFDAIACRGLSGLLIAPQIAVRLEKSLIVVRKGEDCHSSNMVEGDSATLRYIIVDDLIASGSTVRAMHKEIGKFAPKAKCLGVLQAYYFTPKKQDSGRPKFDTELVGKLEEVKSRPCTVRCTDQ